MEHRPAPALLESRHLRQLVAHACREQHPPAVVGLPVIHRDGEGIVAAGHRHRPSPGPCERRIGFELPAGSRRDLGCGNPVLAEETVRQIGKAVAPLAGVDHQHLSAGAKQLKGGRHSGVDATAP